MPCLHCIGLVGRFFPAVKPKDRISFLFKHTCYPCCGCERVQQLLVDLAQKTGGLAEKANEITEQELADQLVLADSIDD